jgi:hypothetical protein
VGIAFTNSAVCESQSGSIFEGSARLGSPDVDHKVSALERAFQLARSGRVANVEDIKKRLKREGYDVSSAYDGRSLRSQLRHLIKAARFERGDPPKRE